MNNKKFKDKRMQPNYDRKYDFRYLNAIVWILPCAHLFLFI